MAEENQDPVSDEAEETHDDAVQEPEQLDGAESGEPTEKKKKKLECPACEAGAPAWMATFADMATLLMAFFVLILSFTEMEDPSITKMLEGTMTEAFGVQRNKPSLEAPVGRPLSLSNSKRRNLLLVSKPRKTPPARNRKNRSWKKSPTSASQKPSPILRT